MYPKRTGAGRSRYTWQMVNAQSFGPRFTTAPYKFPASLSAARTLGNVQPMIHPPLSLITNPRPRDHLITCLPPILSFTALAHFRPTDRHRLSRISQQLYISTDAIASSRHVRSPSRSWRPFIRRTLYQSASGCCCVVLTVGCAVRGQ